MASGYLTELSVVFNKHGRTEHDLAEKAITHFCEIIASKEENCNVLQESRALTIFLGCLEPDAFRQLIDGLVVYLSDSEKTDLEFDFGFIRAIVFKSASLIGTRKDTELPPSYAKLCDCLLDKFVENSASPASGLLYFLSYAIYGAAGWDKHPMYANFELSKKHEKLPECCQSVLKRFIKRIKEHDDDYWKDHINKVEEKKDDGEENGEKMKDNGLTKDSYVYLARAFLYLSNCLTGKVKKMKPFISVLKKCGIEDISKTRWSRNLGEAILLFCGDSDFGKYYQRWFLGGGENIDYEKVLVQPDDDNEEGTKSANHPAIDAIGRCLLNPHLSQETVKPFYDALLDQLPEILKLGSTTDCLFDSLCQVTMIHGFKADLVTGALCKHFDCFDTCKLVAHMLKPTDDGKVSPHIVKLYHLMNSLSLQKVLFKGFITMPVTDLVALGRQDHHLIVWALRSKKIPTGLKTELIDHLCSAKDLDDDGTRPLVHLASTRKGSRVFEALFTVADFTKMQALGEQIASSTVGTPKGPKCRSMFFIKSTIKCDLLVKNPKEWVKRMSDFEFKPFEVRPDLPRMVDESATELPSTPAKTERPAVDKEARKRILLETAKTESPKTMFSPKPQFDANNNHMSFNGRGRGSNGFAPRGRGGPPFRGNGTMRGGSRKVFNENGDENGSPKRSQPVQNGLSFQKRPLETSNGYANGDVKRQKLEIPPPSDKTDSFAGGPSTTPIPPRLNYAAKAAAKKKDEKAGVFSMDALESGFFDAPEKKPPPPGSRPPWRGGGRGRGGSGFRGRGGSRGGGGGFRGARGNSRGGGGTRKVF